MRRRRTRDQRTDKRCHVCGAARTHGCGGGVRRHTRAREFLTNRDRGGARVRAERALNVYGCRCATTRTAERD